ncbi:hypothetical protein Hypma_013805 [Hypsizygus marmoreus]|uniref:F-box domain-containing protein n=1 Tax=Hypsizygus marmoreus TaxID=39966 RepID=A0A369KE83_HYPMA|nr:hypothetical protein Hypma_013805 [Hypsizygus marmoreus]
MHSTQYLPRVPPELQDNVLDQLLHTDFPSLLVCCLVSQSWLVRARKRALAGRQALLMAPHLQSNVSNDGAARLRDAQRFLELLDSPHTTLPSFVQRVCINGPDPLPITREPAAPELPYDQLNSLIIDKLPLLRRVRTIKVSNVTWRHLLPEAKRVIASLPLTKLIFENTTFYQKYDFLRFSSLSFPALEELRVRRIRDEEIERDALPTVTFPSLRLLEVDFEFDNGCGLLSMAPPVYMQPQQVTALYLDNIRRHDVVPIGAFIRAAGPSLKHLALDIVESVLHSGMTRPIPQTLSLSPFTETRISRPSKSQQSHYLLAIAHTHLGCSP